jgi:hypothetical protein
MIYKTFSRRYLPLEKRDRFGLTFLERTKLRHLEKRLEAVVMAKEAFSAQGTIGEGVRSVIME